jgi:DNA-binding response OmpR family regulator
MKPGIQKGVALRHRQRLKEACSLPAGCSSPGLKFCRETKEFWLDGTYLYLGPQETKVMLALAIHAGQITPAEVLKGYFDCESPRDAVHRVIVRLRKYLGKETIENYPGRGYRLVLPVQRVPYEPPSLVI